MGTKRNESDMSVAVLANWYQFGPAQRTVQPRIESRTLLWCKEGRGRVEVNREHYDLSAGRYMLLPWGRKLIYEADRREPFLLAAVHWIPWHEKNREVAFEVAHSRQSWLADAPWRKDEPVGEWKEGVRVGELADAPGLYHLAEYIVVRWSRGGLDSREVRALTHKFTDEVKRVLDRPAGSTFSATFMRLTQFMEDHYSEQLGLEELAEFANCSRATVVRLFRREVKSSPVVWLTRMRIDRAKELLQRSSLSIGEIGERVGLRDSHYFSRVFKQYATVSPRDFRRRSRPF